jgi:hypothetical protein
LYHGTHPLLLALLPLLQVLLLVVMHSPCQPEKQAA